MNVRLAMCVGLGLLVLVGGCATKNHGRMAPLSSLEKEAYDCRELDIEIAKVRSFLDQVNEKSQIDGKSVLGFLGDFGIGNAMERDGAVKSANDRLKELEAAKVAKGCS